LVGNIYKHKVLIAEDNEGIQILLENILNRYSIRPNLASNGKEAVDMVESAEKPYDLIFMDIRMPIMDGLIASQFIRGNSLHKDSIIIGMSANQFSGQSVSPHKELFDDIIKKPFSLEEIDKIFEKYPKLI
jgi:CheY-like chemotaxis protein